MNAIRTRDRCIELASGQVVPIIRRQARRPIETSLPEHRDVGSRARSNLQTIRVARKITIPPHSEAIVKVSSHTSGLRIVEGRQAMWEKKRVVAASGIARIEPERMFEIQVANFSSEPVTLRKGERIATSLPVPIPASQDEVAAIEPDERRQEGLFDPSELSRPFQEIWETIGAISFEGDGTVISGSALDDPENAPGADSPGEISLDHLTPEKRRRVKELVDSFPELWGPDLGRINITRHRLELTEGASPSYAQPYRAGPEKRKIIEAEIEKMLELGVIEPTVSEWAAPVVLAPKPGGKWRFCVDYRKLNSMTKREVYPLPRLEDCIDSLGEAQWFSTLDANSGYWQIEMEEADKTKTAFTAHCGTYRYVRMPATFQRALV